MKYSEGLKYKWTMQRKIYLKTEINMETDTQEKKYTAIIFMIISSVQFNSHLDSPVRENCVGGRVVTDVWMCASNALITSTTITSLTISYSCAWVDMNPQRKLGHRVATQSHTITVRGGKRTDVQTHMQSLPHSYYTHTLWLSELVEDHNVMGVVEVFR